MSEYKYCAFISYRHQSPDQEIARRLHTMIETYRLGPTLRRRLGKTRLGKVFRDSEELPLSPNLGDDITSALDQSEWFIAVCSPRYLESRWCQRELEYFLSKNGPDKVLTVLVEGEPEDSFPEPLRIRRDETGKAVEIEPLAADSRGSSLRECLKKLRKEKLRILAPMLGVGFDDLYQRQHRRTVRNILMGSAALMVALGAFLAYALVQNARIDAERLTAARNECDLLVEKSIYYTSEKRKVEARQLALEAWQVSRRIDGYGGERVQDALAVTCYAGDFGVEAELSVPGVFSWLYSFSPDGRKIAAVVSQAEVVCYDADSGETLWITSPLNLSLSSLNWSGDSRFLAASSDASFGENNNTVCVMDAETGLVLHAAQVPRAASATFLGDKVMIAFEEGILEWNLETEEILYALKPENSSPYFTSQVTPDGRFILWRSMNEPYILVLDAGEQLYAEFTRETPRVIGSCALSPDGRYLFAHQWDRVCVYDLHTDQYLWEAEASEEDTVISGRNAVWVEGRIFDSGTVYDAATGEALYRIDDQCLGATPDGLCFLCAGGLYHVEDGSLFCEAPGELLAADSTGEHLLIRQETTYKAASPGKGSQYAIDRYEGALTDIPDWTQPAEIAGLYDPIASPQTGGFNAYNVYMERLCISPDTRFYVQINHDDQIRIYDLEKGNTPAFRLYGFSSGGSSMVADASFSADSRLVAFAGGMGNIAVYELETGVNLRTWLDQYPKKSLSGVKFNREGTLIMAADGQQREFYIYSVVNGLKLYTMHAVKAVGDWGFDEETGDGIVLYEDGSAIAADIFASAEELYRYAEQYEDVQVQG